FRFSPLFAENREQIRRAEQLSDAYHLTFGDDELMVAYLLEIRDAHARTVDLAGSAALLETA
ncbi:MAG: hypothetical protein H0V40_01305, partial [Actinobacteria bacterium]|nr:hypothetical protein [Actinomycetota bacterium]